MDDRRPGHIRVTQVRGREPRGRIVALRIGRTIVLGGEKLTRIANAKNGDVQVVIESVAAKA